MKWQYEVRQHGDVWQVVNKTHNRVLDAYPDEQAARERLKAVQSLQRPTGGGKPPRRYPRPASPVKGRQ